MIISVASGKGGTGKTTVATNLALSLENVLLLDCDVEEPNDHLLLNPKLIKQNPVFVTIPSIQEDKCDYCGKCADFCKFNALFVANKKVMVFPQICTSCEGCKIICPKNAITDKKREIGKITIGSTRDIELIYGELNIGEPMAIPIIKAVKNHIRPLEQREVIIDSPPGTSCPVIETVLGSDFTILVTEPTPFGLHDLKITVDVLRKLKIPFGVVINQSDIGDLRVHNYCNRNFIPILMEIPYSRKIAELYSKGIPFLLEIPEWKQKFKKLFEKISGITVS
jgi:MinD superfamily P-loop ATPase